jgi:hypothetical protein
MCTKPARNPAPVTNPDRGAKYLKKSPSPTGVKSLPGGSCTTTAEAYLQKKAAVSTGQQVIHVLADTN